MGPLNAIFEAWPPRLRSVLRIVAALLFLQSPLAKLFDFPQAPSFAVSPLFHAAGIVEIIGAPLLLLGIFTRLAAFLLSGEMACAYFLVYAPRSFYPFVSGGDLAALYCFVFLYLAFAGGGPWSLDAVIFRRPSASS